MNFNLHKEDSGEPCGRGEHEAGGRLASDRFRMPSGTRPSTGVASACPGEESIL